MNLISRLREPPKRVFNGIAFFSFATILCCLLSPSTQILDPIDSTTIILAPLKFAFNSLFLLLFSILSLSWDSLAWLLWISIGLIWLVRAGYCLIKSPRSLKQFRWWIAPALIWIASLIWATHLLLGLNFKLHQPELEKLADRVNTQTAQNQASLVKSSQRIGTFSIVEAYPIPELNGLKSEPPESSAAPIQLTSIEIEGLWAHQGFVRDLSRKPGGFKPIDFSLAPGSNNGDQTIFYLGEGWYAFQNLLD